MDINGMFSFSFLFNIFFIANAFIVNNGALKAKPRNRKKLKNRRCAADGEKFIITWWQKFRISTSLGVRAAMSMAVA